MGAFGNATDELLAIAADAFHKFICNDLIEDAEYHSVFSLLRHSAPAIRRSAISALRKETTSQDIQSRRKLVHAGLLPFTISLLPLQHEDVVAFLASDILAHLGPEIAATEGVGQVLGLLQHPDNRLRFAARDLLKGIIDSPDANFQLVVAAGLIPDLYSMIGTDTARELWAYLVPNLSGVVSRPSDIDILFQCLRSMRGCAA